MSQQTTLTFGQQLAFAHRALGGPLRRTLATRGVEPGTWYALITIATRGSAVPAVELRSLLAEASDVESVEGLLDRLEAEGLIAVDDGTVDSTPEGKALFASLRETVQARTAELLKPFDPADIETTTRVLRELIERSEELQPA
jgi:DNA-binding MarR family transcriptional regulator